MSDFRATYVVFYKHPQNGFLFLVQGDRFLYEELKNQNPTQWAVDYQLKRHDVFDWECNKARQGFGLGAVFLFQCEVANAAQFLDTLNISDLHWLSFPVAAKTLLLQQDRNVLQLVVQYLAAEGGVDQSLVAACAEDVALALKEQQRFAEMQNRDNLDTDD